MPAWSCLQHAPHGYDESWSKETLGHRRCAAEVGSGARCSGCSHCPTHAASTTAAGGGAGAARTSCRCAIPACRRSAGSLVQCPSCGSVLAAWLAARPAQAGSQTPSQVAAPAPAAVQGGRCQQAGASMPVRGSKLGCRGAAERANWRVLRVLPPPHERKLDAASTRAPFNLLRVDQPARRQPHASHNRAWQPDQHTWWPLGQAVARGMPLRSSASRCSESAPRWAPRPPVWGCWAATGWAAAVRVLLQPATPL